jgi:FkbM family methyltransferase
MTPLVALLLPALRWCVLALRLRIADPPAAMRFVHALLLVPPFATLWALLRLHGLLRGAAPASGESAFGATFNCRLPDMIQTYIHLFGIWEPDVTAFVARRLKPGDAFIDVGANVGYFSLLASRLVGDGGSVAAIEAAPAIHEQLVENLALNGSPPNIRTINMAASRERGTLQLFRGPMHNRGLTSTVQHRGMQPETAVEAAPLGELLTTEEIERTRLIKIDVEGGEDGVLAGMLPLLDRLPPDVELLVELSPTWWDGASRALEPREVLRPFVEAGFNVYELDNNYWPWRYLWAGSVRPPRRVRRELAARVARIDLVLSRVDAEEL